jgi:hypothetical protein
MMILFHKTSLSVFLLEYETQIWDTWRMITYNTEANEPVSWKVNTD